MFSLPPISPSVRPLTNEQSQWLNKEDSSSKVSVDKCITCKGKKTFRWYSDARNEASISDFECNCVDQYLLYRKFSYLGVTPRYSRYNWVDSGVPDELLPFLSNRDRYLDIGIGLVLQGSGNSKSFLASFLIKDLICKGLNARMFSASNLKDRFMDTWDRGEDRRIARNWLKVETQDPYVLVLDGLGEEKNLGDSNSIFGSALDSLISFRVSKELPTVITTNLNNNELQIAYGKRILDFIEQSSIFVKIFDDFDINSLKMREVELGVTRPILGGNG